MTSSAVFHYVEGYIFTLLILEVILTAGLNSYISTNFPTVTPPTLSTPPTPSNVTWYDSIVSGFNYVIYFFQNIAFLFSLTFATGTLSSFALLGWIFTFMSVMFIISLILIIRG